MKFVRRMTSCAWRGFVRNVEKREVMGRAFAMKKGFLKEEICVNQMGRKNCLQ